MLQASDYTNLITAEHADKPKYTAMVAAVAGAFAGVTNLLQSLPKKFDLDSAAGAQLDAVGRWVGLSRSISVPLAVYFSLDTEGLGFDQGNWKQELDPGEGLTTLDDDSYRALIRAKIGANNWDGTHEMMLEIYQSIFGVVNNNTLSEFESMTDSISSRSFGEGAIGEGPIEKEFISVAINGGTNAFIVDNQDMSMDVYISGTSPSALMRSILTNNYVPIKPEGVRINGYTISSVNRSPLFGFDIQNGYIAGFNTGSFGVAL